MDAIVRTIHIELVLYVVDRYRYVYIHVSSVSSLRDVSNTLKLVSVAYMDVTVSVCFVSQYSVTLNTMMLYFN